MLRTGRWLGSIHFDLQKQIDHINGHGTAVSVSPCLSCPCVVEEGQWNPNCRTCYGTGRFYPPSAVYATMLLLVHESAERTFQETGSWIAGTIQATVLPGIRLAERDKVIMLDIKAVYNDEVLTRGLDDTLRFAVGVALTFVGDRERVYRPTLDYTLTFPNMVAWTLGGNQPSFGSQYSVSYEACPEFLVVPQTPRLRVEHRRAQSQRVVLMRYDHVTEGS